MTEKCSFTNVEIGNPIPGFYQFVINKSNEHTEVIKKFFIIDGLGLCKKLKSHVAHMLYGWNFHTSLMCILRFVKKNRTSVKMAIEPYLPGVRHKKI